MFAQRNTVHLAIIALLMTAIPASAGTSEEFVDNTVETAEHGYYYNLEEATWYYYDGDSIVPDLSYAMPFLSFDLTHNVSGSSEGWKLRVAGSFVGSHSMHYRVEYAFEDAAGSWCDDVTPAPCTIENTVETRDTVVLGSTVLGTFDFFHRKLTDFTDQGWAESWGWLDAENHDVENATEHAGPISWGNEGGGGGGGSSCDPRCVKLIE